MDKEMIGRKFGCWEVLGEFHTPKPGKHYECLCECGTITVIPGTTLRAGRSTKCRPCMRYDRYKPHEMVGKRFGKWTVTKWMGVKNRYHFFETKCDCGNLGQHYSADLRAGKTNQCTICHNRENAIKNTKHGMHKSNLYKIWSSMHPRCRNPKDRNYRRYGERGIKVCDRWNDFKSFHEDVGDQPPGLTLDRIDNDGNYEPGNVRWVTHQENCQNRGAYPKNRKSRKSKEGL